jgi:modulator of FtsH protease HflK
MNGQPDDAPIAPAPGGRPGSHRPASVNLRAGAPGAASADTLDPANQSLADALRIISRLLSGAMAILAVLFALSGFQSIQEGEKGVSLLFGKVTGQDLPPGFQFSFPRPMGELIRIPTGAIQQELDHSFWPYLSESERKLSIETLPQKPSLNPGLDGSVITSDEALAHTRWKVVYSRDNIEKFARNILPEDEGAIVRAAVERGVVQAVAQTKIDALLRQGTGETGSVALRAMQVAQRMLDGMESGIRIDQLQLRDRMPPLRVRSDFAQVQSAESNGAQIRQDALAERDRVLNEVAGAAAPYLAEQIDRYEEAIAVGDAPAQDRIVETINSLLEGRPTDVVRADGTTETVGNIVAGAVTSTIADAIQYRSSIAGQTQAQYTEFKAKLEQFESNPLVMVNRDWADAYSRFLDRDSVQVILVPPGVQIVDILLNADPDILKDQLAAEKLQKGIQAERDREQRRQEERHRVDTGKQMLQGK